MHADRGETWVLERGQLVHGMNGRTWLDGAIFDIDGCACAEVQDDGGGGATSSEGSGLSGLKDRVDALDGTLEVKSPPGGGTTVRAGVPCA